MGFRDNLKNAYAALWGNASTYGTPAKTDLNRAISPAELQRIRQDVMSWRTALNEAEAAWYPHRVRIQQLINDTALNGHVRACWEKRKNLTLLRDWQFEIDGNKSDEWTEFFSTVWFDMLMSYALDGMAYGYQLIALGNIVNNSFPDLTIVKRENISPDRWNVGQFMYSVTGQNFLEPPYVDWHVWVTTPTDNRASECGYGLFFYCGIYEIYLRNLLGFNADAAEMFGQPYRIGKTLNRDEETVKQMAEALRNMGSSGWAIIDPTDEIAFLESSVGSSGYQIYADLEKRCEAKISKLILGHANAMDEQSGKLGAGQGEDNPVHEALEAIQVKDGKFVQNIINNQLLPKMKKLGFKIPEKLKFNFNNDKEKEDYRRKVDESNKVTADIFKVIKDAGGKPDWKYFEERTGIPVEAAPEPKQQTFTPEIQNKLNKIYSHKH